MKYWHNGIGIIVLIQTVLHGVLSQGGKWSKWGEWSTCSVTCGYGVQRREKVWLPDPKSRHGGVPYKYEDIMECYTKTQCPVDGGWSYWGPWSECSEMCGGGTMMRYRECTNPKPINKGKFCEGKNFEEGTCNEWLCPPLPVDFDISKCNETTFMCISRLQCIQSGNVCDSTLQCHDGSDEYECIFDYYPGSGVSGVFTFSLTLIVPFVVGVVKALL